MYLLFHALKMEKKRKTQRKQPLKYKNIKNKECAAYFFCFKLKNCKLQEGIFDKRNVL